MNWLLHHRGYFSACGQYELRPTYTGGRFAWHGRHIDSDRLIASSGDREFVRMTCERDAAKAEAEASA
jgi:hypothetical protein